MNVTGRSERASILTARMSSFMKENFSLGEGLPILAGLPAGATLHGQARTVLAQSVCTYNLFEEPMTDVSRRGNYDVVLMRHGFYPESLDDVRFDVVVRVGTDRMMLRDLLLYLDETARAWLIPADVGPYLRVGSDGVGIHFDAPFDTLWQRSEGLNFAARQIVGAAQGREMAHG